MEGHGTQYRKMSNSVSSNCNKCQVYESQLVEIGRQVSAFSVLVEKNPGLSPHLLIHNLQEVLEKSGIFPPPSPPSQPLEKNAVKFQRKPQYPSNHNEEERDSFIVNNAAVPNDEDIESGAGETKESSRVIESNWDQVVKSFDEMNLDPKLLRGIYAYSFAYPSSIQQRVIIPCISGYDVIAQGKSETGRTIAVCISVLQRLHHDNPHCQALILTLNIEAAQKIQGMILSLGAYLGVSCHVTRMYRDDDYHRSKGDRQIVVGTPADVHSLILRHLIQPSTIRMVVIDDADKLLGGSFKFDVFNVIESLDSREIQVIRMTRTMSSEVLDGMRSFMRHPVTILVKDINERNVSKFKGVWEFYVDVKTEEWKLSTLSNLEMKLKNTQSPSLVFCNSPKKVDWLSTRMREKRIQVVAMHGEMDEMEREEILQEFSHGSVSMLITDYWIPGIDTSSNQQPSPVLINYDFPTSPKNYIQRIGFSRRFGSGGGIAISFVTKEDEAAFQEIQQVLATVIEELPTDLSKYLEGESNYPTA